jgi:Ca-activated chloride channel family protein
MNFLAPAAFLLAALLPVIVAMYLLKLRRSERVVSSVYLWRRMVRDVEANAPWQRLRRNWLMLLQLLFLIVLILVLARPFTWAQGASGNAAIFILDTSASMGAQDVAPNRLEAAKSEARRLVESLPENARITVIAAGSQAQVLASSSLDRRQVLQAIEGIQLTTQSSEMGVALELASAVAARQPDTEIILLSDGRVDLPQQLGLKGHLRYLPIGLRGDNQAISSLSLEPSSSGGRLTGFAQVNNYAGTTSQRRLAFYADGQLVDAYDLEIAPGEAQAVLAEGLPPDTQQLEASLSGTDDLPNDDRAFAVRSGEKAAQVRLVTEGNLFLGTAVSLLPGLDILPLTPEEWEAGNAKAAELESQAAGNPPPDLTIFDSYTPITATLPPGNLLFIAPLRSTEYFTVTGSVENPALRAVDITDPLLANVSLAGINVLDSARISVPDWARVVIAGDLAAPTGTMTAGEPAPLLLAGEVDGRRIGVVAFDLRRSDLPLQVAFPLLWANLIHWLAPGSGGELPTQVAPGESLTLVLPPEASTVSVTRPDGSTARLTQVNGRVIYGDIVQLGVYQLHWGEGQGASFAVNLFSPQESDIQPAENLPILEAQNQQASLKDGRARREWWRPLALVSLGLLMIEWIVYQRAALSRLLDGMKFRLSPKRSKL